MERYFPAQIEQGDSTYGAWFADFDGCVSAGRTIAEAIEGAHEALALHVAGMIEDGEAIPEPSEPRLEDGSIAVAMVGVTLPGRKKRVNVMIDEGLLAAIDAISDNRSRFLEKAARKAFAMSAETKPPARKSRLGFLKGQFTIPDDFDRMGEAEIAAMFSGADPK